MATTKGGGRAKAAKGKRAAKKVPAKKKPSGKKAAAKKAPAKKKAAAKKAPAKKKSPVKKAAAKKAPATKKPAAKKAAAKEAPATKKPPAKKAPANEAATRDSTRVKKARAGKRRADAVRASAKAPAVKAHRPKARMGPAGIMILADDKVLRRTFYGGQQIPSPNGGFLMQLGIRPGDGGGATVLFECSVSSLRYQMSIPKATRTERAKVKDAQGAGDDPDCPRHGPGQRLVRAGKLLVCAECGIGYGKV
jgi:hypothetical protein